MRVSELWRFPVKSLRGERLPAAVVGSDGLAGDRLVHVREAGGRVVTSRYRPRLLGLTATLGPDGEPLIEGRRWDVPESLEAVRAASSPDVELVRFSPPDHGQRYDVLPLTILTDGMIEAVGFDHRRFRPNIVISGVDGLAEREWVGRALLIGTTLVGVRKPRERCVMTTFDPDTLERDPAVLRRVVAEFGGMVALDCWVIRPGPVAVGDEAEVVDLPPETTLPPGNAAR